MTDFKMPSLGADMESATLVEWMVKPGDTVSRGDVVAVVETDKGAIDVEIFEDGVIQEILVPVDEVARVGTVLAKIRVEGEPEEAAIDPATLDTAPGAKVKPLEERKTLFFKPSDLAASGSAPVSPRARKRATELGVDLNQVHPTGPGGSITAEDVERTAAPRDAAAGMRAAIAAAMSRSKREIPHYYLGHTIDLEASLGWLEKHNASRPVTERVLPIALLVRAVARALQEFPELCGWWRGDGFVPSAGVHVGVAVSLRGGGLINPAIRDADQLSLVDLFTKIRDVTKRARSGGLRSSELSDGAITVTNLGDQGVDDVFGVIHPPQVAIIGFGTIATRPAVVGTKIEARRTVRITLSADHRASDGHFGARFLRRVDKLLQESPES